MNIDIVSNTDVIAELGYWVHRFKINLETMERSEGEFIFNFNKEILN